MPKGVFQRTEKHLKVIKRNFHPWHAKGDKNRRWKGDLAGYSAVHLWLRNTHGKADHCENDLSHLGPFEWANISGKYKRDRKDFKPLCIPCHRKFDHAIPHGEAHSNSKLKEPEVLEIRALYAKGGISQGQLARMFNISQSVIFSIVNGGAWKHLQTRKP